MKKIQLGFLAFVAICFVAPALLFSGCVLPNPAHNPGDVSSPAYIVNPQPAATLAGVSNAVNGFVPLFPPAQPFVPLANMIFGVIAGAITLASSAIAYSKNKTAIQHEDTATVLATTVAAHGLSAIALQEASTYGNISHVATALDNVTIPVIAKQTPKPV